MCGLTANEKEEMKKKYYNSSDEMHFGQFGLVDNDACVHGFLSSQFRLYLNAINFYFYAIISCDVRFECVAISIPNGREDFFFFF